MMKKKNLRSFMAIAMTLAAFVLSAITFTACGDEADFLIEKPTTPTPGGNNDPKPEMYVYSVTKTGCEATNIEWKSSENVTLSRAYADSDMEGYASATISHKYSVEIEYRDKNGINGAEFKEMSQNYTTSLMARLYGLNSPMVFESLEALETAKGNVAKADDAENYELYTLSFGGSKQVVLKQSAEMSTFSLSFEGKNMTDLCSAVFSTPEYDSKSYEKVETDKEGYDKYIMTIRVKLTIANVGTDNNVRYLTFKVSNVYVKQAGNNGGDIPVVPSQKEIIGYKVTDNNFDGGATKGNIIVIYDDFSEEKVGSFNVELNHYSEEPKDVEQNGLSDLSWSQGETTSVELAATGNSRSEEVEAGCSVNITEVFTSMTNRSKVPMTFKGIWETAKINFPDGTSADLKVGAYELTDGTVEEVSATESSKTIQHTVYAKFNSGTPDLLKANVILNKSTEPVVEEKEVGIIIEKFEARGDNYIFDIVHYWTISEPTRESVSIPHYAVLSAEGEKSTSSRNYNTTTPTMVGGGSETYSSTTNGGTKIEGTITSYTSDFVFEGANVKVTSKFLNYFKLTSKAGNTAMWDIKTNAYKTGSTIGTKDHGDETAHIYKDKVHFALPVNSVNIATCEQVLVYSEGITPPPAEEVTDTDATIISNEIDFINGYWTATMKVTITNSKGETRDTTMTRVYTNAGVNYGSIADFVSEDNTFTLPTISKKGSATTENSGNITYSTQKYNSVANKFTQDITVVNGSSSVVIAGKTLNFKSTEIALTVTGKDQVTAPTFSNGYDVWASSVSYTHGFSNHFDNETSNFNILVERAPVNVVIGDEIIAGAITVTVDANTQPMLSLVIATKNKTLIYNSTYDFKNPTNAVNLDQTPIEAKAMTFTGTPSAVNFGIGTDREPANLLIGTGEWAYYNAAGTPRLFSASDVLTTGCTNPIVAVGELQKDGSLKIQNGNDVVYFKVK